jgi:predicted small integral membrane protein
LNDFKIGMLSGPSFEFIPFSFQSTDITLLLLESSTLVHLAWKTLFSSSTLWAVGQGVLSQASGWMLQVQSEELIKVGVLPLSL